MIAHIGFQKGTKKGNRIEEAHHSSEMYLYILPVLNPTINTMEKKTSSKNDGLMVINPMVESVQHHLKN